jgi:hypothetical protein
MKQPMVLLVGVLCLSIVVCITAITSLGTNANNTFSYIGTHVGQMRKEASQADAGLAVAERLRAQAEGKDAAPEAAKPLPRKIIYRGQLALVVDEFDQAVNQLEALVKEQKGYVSKKEVKGTPGTPRTGTWTVRIPAASFDDFLASASHLGEVRRTTLETEDVTDQYFDTRAEVKNLEAREDALRGLYKEKIAGTKVADLIEVDRELNHVRTDINVRKGRLQRWDQETEYSTLVVELQDRRGYVPPVVPDFGTSLGRTFQWSVEGLLATGRFLLLVVVALVPWVVVLGLLVVLPGWIVYGRMGSRRPIPATAPDAPAAGVLDPGASDTSPKREGGE